MDSTRLARRFSLPIFIFLLISVISCSAKTPGQQKFGVDADYFYGLKLLSQGKEKEARSKFNRCVKKGSYYVAQKSAQTLCTFGSVQEKNQAAENLISKFNDKDSLLIAAKQFESSGELTKLLEATQNLDFKTDKNDLIKIRLTALKVVGSSSYKKEVFEWFMTCPISQSHYQFYRDIFDHPDFEASYADDAVQIDYSPEDFAINYRVELYKRNYTYTFTQAKKIFEYFEDGRLQPCAQLASDVGKSYLYGSMDFATNAAYFKSLAKKFSGSEIEFYLWFYAGRLYEKAGPYYSQTKSAFDAAIKCAGQASQKDNALWYLLNTSINYSVDSIIQDIGNYAKMWSDPAYFDDFFEVLISSLLASGRWNSFKSIYQEIDGYASDEIVAQFAYIYARLVQEGLADGNAEDVHRAFTRALNAGTSVYYRVMAAYNLGLEAPVEIGSPAGNFTQMDNFTPEGAGKQATPAAGSRSAPVGKSTALVNQTFAQQGKSTTQPGKSPSPQAAQILLEGYAYFGFPQLIYPTWQEVYQQGLPTDTYFYLADFLQKLAEDDGSNDYYTQSLRIASRGQKNADRPLTMEELKLVYPKDYSQYVEKYSEKYGLNPAVLYALIRSESFFDADVSSTAGAIGLTQLMEFTAGDIARKLKMTEYSLTDPEDSIQMGSFYLAELIRRCDDNQLLGFFSYNAGITRVRRWLQSSLIEFGKKSNMPLDLFLETVPYSETREYGRKLVSATTMYEFLENPQNFASIVKELMKS